MRLVITSVLAATLAFSPLSAWAQGKLGLWLVIAGLPVLAKRRVLPAGFVVVLGALVGAALAGLGWFKPTL